MIVFITSLTLNSCSKSSSEIINSNKIVQTFFESATFLRHKSDLENFGTIDYKNAATTKLAVNNNRDSFNLIFVPIMKNKTIIGTLQVVELGIGGILPNNDLYALNYMDAKEFNYSTLSGKLRMVDMNYDNYIHSNIVVENNQIKSWKATGLPQALSDKYPRSSQKIATNSISSGSGTSNPTSSLSKPKAIYGLCDSDHNSNISWSECVVCATNAIAADGFAVFVCGISSIGTTWAPWWGGCVVSVGAACVYVSARY